MFLHSSKIKKTRLARKELFLLGTAIYCAVLVISSYGASAAHAKKLSQNPNKDDPAIADTVKNELLSDRTIASTGMDVTVTSGIVTLKGKTTNLLAKHRAQVLAETVRGVRAVINRID
jgi:osmotically-inducible protein OsmY